MVELQSGENVLRRGDAGQLQPVSVRPDDDLDGRRARRRPLGRGRVDRPRRRGRRDHQLRPRAGLLARRGAGRRPAFKVPMQALEEAKQRSPFIANLFCRFSDYLLSQVMQSAACNAFHSIPERAARWLLHAQDRAGDRIELTQEAFAGLLGVQRTTVNAVDPDAAGRRPDHHRARRGPGHRPCRPQAPGMRMLPAARRTISARSSAPAARGGRSADRP